jgi:hypothetical protein
MVIVTNSIIKNRKQVYKKSRRDQGIATCVFARFDLDAEI